VREDEVAAHSAIGVTKPHHQVTPAVAPRPLPVAHFPFVLHHARSDAPHCVGRYCHCAGRLLESGPHAYRAAGGGGGVVILIGPTSAGKAGCNEFTPDTATATTGQPIQWRNTTSDSVSLQVAYVRADVFVTVPPNELSIAQTGFAPGTVLYGPTSCDSLNAYLTIKP
jgi:hypothetical protein